MIEGEAPCIDILTQVSAVTSAMKKTGRAVIQANMAQCMSEYGAAKGKSMEDFQVALARYISLA
jgi:DNA-binding FrmR family transcriptional regulator